MLNQSWTLNWNYRIEIKVIHSFKLILFHEVVNNKERGRGQRSVAGLAQARSALLALTPCAQYRVFLAATLFV